MKRAIATVNIAFSDGSYVKWTSIAKNEDFNRKMYKIQVRVENSPNSIDEFFETWDKPSMHTASHFIGNAIKNAKSNQQ